MGRNPLRVWRDLGVGPRGNSRRAGSINPSQSEISQSGWSFHTAVSVKPRAPLPRHESLNIFSMGFTIWKIFGGSHRRQGLVYDYGDRYVWRVRYSDQSWKALTHREMNQLQSCGYS